MCSSDLRGYGIPPYMVGSTKAGAVAYASTSNARIDYVVHTVVPMITRIEKAYASLIPSADIYVKFNLNALLRGDQKSRFESYQLALANRFVTINEVRGWEEMPPFAGADGGFLNTPNNSAPPPAGSEIPPTEADLSLVA